MLLVRRIVESDRYQDEKDKKWPYDLDQQLNLETKTQSCDIYSFAHHTELFRFLPYEL